MSVDDQVHRGIHTDCLPTKDEDRTVILPFQYGVLVAIFDGHHSSELSDYASQILPRRVADAFDPELSAEDLEQSIATIFEDFDRALLERFIEYFGKDVDWEDPKWDDLHEVLGIIGYDNSEESFRVCRRAVVGTTVLMGIIDKANSSVWIVSLGDSCAVIGRMHGDKLVPHKIHESHNCDNEEEVERIVREHPGETGLVTNHWGGPCLVHALSVTRALGDHQLKVELPLASGVMMWVYPSPIIPVMFDEWKKNGNLSPPYLSSTPTVRRFDLLPGDTIVFASDGLADSMYGRVDAEHRWDVIMALLSGRDHDKLGHKIFKPEQEMNKAELLIRNVLFGVDEAKMVEEMLDRQRDDISVVVVEVDLL
ncbi:PPM-type phosphatase domain-containing protein [Mycena chlorophos]|uniref:PPM-type phosphatase domain-containing protein n=1 Tax=Mycena chlorophos TaxID=658473 RepID=A0A8H6S7P4_MYCCL|nr:PPM-type phosphatase domain-containing protein [Mycena chlorophos]